MSVDRRYRRGNCRVLFCAKQAYYEESTVPPSHTTRVTDTQRTASSALSTPPHSTFRLLAASPAPLPSSAVVAASPQTASRVSVPLLRPRQRHPNKLPPPPPSSTTKGWLLSFFSAGALHPRSTPSPPPPPRRSPSHASLCPCRLSCSSWRAAAAGASPRAPTREPHELLVLVLATAGSAALGLLGRALSFIVVTARPARVVSPPSAHILVCVADAPAFTA